MKQQTSPATISFVLILFVCLFLTTLGLVPATISTAGNKNVEMLESHQQEQEDTDTEEVMIWESVSSHLLSATQ